jgi:squalene-hopene/tetraprenyl-beta-curcumene cyclase
MNKKNKSKSLKTEQIKKLVEELIGYLQADLFERNASRVIPAFSRSNLFKKPQNWEKLFNNHGSNGRKNNDAGKWLQSRGVDPADLTKVTEYLLDSAIIRAQDALLNKQDSKEGCWCAPLRADTTLESDTITLYAYMGWLDRKKDKVQKLANYILSQQLSDGGWNIYRNGPAEISATVKAYWALKIAGHSADQPYMEKARQKIFQLGGVHKINSYSKFYMALFGLYDWRGVPAIPPELMLFPKWFYFNIYEMSSWTRGIVIPLSIVWAMKPKKTLPAYAHLEELFEHPSAGGMRWVPVGSPTPADETWFSWRKFFLAWDRFFKVMEGRGPHFFRVWSLNLAKKWMIEHFAHSDGLAAIFPPIVNSIMALESLGYSESHPYVQGQLRALEEYEIHHPQDNRLEMQPCLSPIWDTAISIIALAESGLRRDHPKLVQALEWLIRKEIRRDGDWKVKNPTGPIGGWAFEFNNDFYPDVDDTAMVLLALRLVHLAEDGLDQRREKAYLRGLNWMLSMQCSNGGWAAFDRDNVKFIFEKIPFADHNAMIDPPSVDITGRVLELLGYVGYDKTYPCIQKALEYLKQNQEPDGSWYGRWGVNYIYGTWQVLRGLEAIGEDMNSAYVQKACQWLKSVQNTDGGWGERCDTYDDASHKGKGPSTPSQTAWGLMGLMACGLMTDPAVTRAVHYLLSTQRQDGTWDEQEFTGTGFPKVFYLEYVLYRDYFPLLALGVFKHRLGLQQGTAKLQKEIAV